MFGARRPFRGGELWGGLFAVQEESVETEEAARATALRGDREHGEHQRGWRVSEGPEEFRHPPKSAEEFGRV